MRETILIVDDEADVLDLVRYHLNRAGFDVDVASSGTAALLAARQRRPDAIVLDIMLPQMSGTEVFRKLKLEIDTAQIPVLMLTAKGLLSERIAGLELGVDDYITKPFSPRELVLRVQNLLRRIRETRTSAVVEVDGFCLNKSNFEITVQGRRLELTTTEFKLLATLVERRGRTLSRDRTFGATKLRSILGLSIPMFAGFGKNWAEQPAES